MKHSYCSSNCQVLESCHILSILKLHVTGLKCDFFLLERTKLHSRQQKWNHEWRKHMLLICKGDEMKVICNNSESEEERGKQFATTAVYMSFPALYVFFACF